MNGAPLEVQLREALRRCGEADGMAQILRSNLQQEKEEKFELYSSMATFEAETRYESNKKEREMQAEIAALKSKLSFTTSKLQNAERVKLRIIKDMEELQQKQLVERKRRDAERRLLATKRRKHDSFIASQSMMMSQRQSQPPARPPPVPVVETAVQTELKLGGEGGKDGGNRLKEENARLVSYLLTGTSRDLLTLLNGTVAVSVGEDSKPSGDEDRTQPPQGYHSATPTQYFQGSSGNSLNDSLQQSASGVQFSQSVFSQVAGRASAQAHASLLSFAMETKAAQSTLTAERAQELYDVMGRMLAGDVSAVALAPVFVKYLAAPTDLEVSVICSVLRVMYSVIHHSVHFQHFLLAASSPSDESSSSSTGIQRGANSMEHARIALPGLRFTSLDDYLSARTDCESVVQSDLLQLSVAEAASEQSKLRSKLLTGLCRVIKNNLKEPAVVKDGLCVLCFTTRKRSGLKVGFSGERSARSQMGKLAAFQTLLFFLVVVGVDVALAIDKSCFELPIVIVSPTKVKLPTETCNQPRLPAPDCMRDSVEANIEVIDNQGSLNCLNGNRTAVYPASVHYRGQSSLHFAKHQISVDLDEDAELLGFPADRSYVLNGPTVDGSLMRNHLAHWMYRGTGRYSPRTRHVVVFVRDKLDAADWSPRYRGIYLALEKIAYTPNRVGLSALDNSCQSKEELSGGWAWQNNPLGYGDYSPNIVLNEATGLFGAGARPILTFPEPKALTKTMRDHFISPETGPLPRLYQYLYDNMTHPDGLEEHIDIGSFVDYFLHSELSVNSDAYRRSTYFFKDRNQPINAGPVWDFNLAYGLGSATTAWMYTIHTFWKRLACNYKFASLVQQRWMKLRSTTWSDEAIRSFIQGSAEPIHRQLRNCAEWKSDNIQCANVEAKTKGSFEDLVNGLLKAVLARASWMDSNVAGFYTTLDHNLCVAAGELPAYNCAADGNDKGCLVNPSTYSNAVEFPQPRKPLAAKSCGGSKVSSTGTTALEKPSIDPCWLSAGVYMSDGSITPFCSGYGFCPEGPGANCTCKSGHSAPTCARDDDAIMPRGGLIDDSVVSIKPLDELSSSSDKFLRYPLFFLCAAPAMALGMALAARRRRRQHYIPM
ncbi:hypothetical protein PR001_g1074 [Phytophthora rubi]|uniref:Uncharacterized protein n=2 Tax=Phytophthora rubi TaxID=129364 RepID=A0A6A3P4C2_9STRA|nr:hypothetical protein PR001_g1074 [Phytophthora rubi]